VKALNCFLTNSQSILNKLPELRALVAQNHYDIIGITESWCNNSVSDSELSLKGYNLFRADRKIGSGGGVLLYLHESLSAVLYAPLMDFNIDDSLWCTVTLKDNEQLLIGVVYRSPSSSEDNNSRLLSAIRSIDEFSVPHVLLTGDFNVSGINWEDSVYSGSESSLAANLLDATNDAYLFQHVSGVTRHRRGQRSSLLDLVFTLDSNSIHSIHHHSPLGSSDHECLTWQYECFSDNVTAVSSSEMYNYWKGNYPAMCQELDTIDWEVLFCNNPIDVNWVFFKEKVTAVIDKCIPKVVKKPPSNKPPWWSGAIAKAIKRKHQLYSTFQHTHSGSDYDAYAFKRNEVKSMVRAAQATYERQLIDKFSANPKALYGYVRDKSKCKQKIGPLTKPDGSSTSSDGEVAEVLNDYFQSVFTSESDTVELSHDGVAQLSEVSITELEVFEALSSLKPNKAPGPDNLNPQVLKYCAGSLAKPLFLLFTESLNTGVLPSDWRQANVTPIFKKGCKVSPENYRPVSLTSQVVKVLESLVRSRVLGFLDDNEIITSCQHGFIRKKSCFTNLLSTLEDWTLALDQGFGVDVAYLDFTKAFDSVPHRRLFQKLASYGFGGKLLSWLKGFLSHRYQRVVLNGSSSSWCPVTSGVPQGSVLGPLLFTLYINDIANIIHTNLSFFADDSKVYTVIRSLEDSYQLQVDLDNIQNWCQIWLLKLNLLKCKVMRVGNSLTTSGYTLNNTGTGQQVLLTEVDYEKDLGVWISNDLKPSLHCCKAAASAMRVLSMIKRSFVNPSKELFTFLYTTYVRPHLDYCSTIWSPYFAKDIDLLEKVQRRATKLIRGFSKLAYGQRLRSLGLFTLFRRRQRGDLIETFKILKGYYDINPTTFFSPATATQTRGHHMKLFKHQCRINLRANFFTQRVIDSWNSLSDEIVSSSTVGRFKAKLDKEWMLGYGYDQRLPA